MSRSAAIVLIARTKAGARRRICADGRPNPKGEQFVPVPN